MTKISISLKPESLSSPAETETQTSTSAVVKLTAKDVRYIEANPEQIASELYLKDLVGILKLCSDKYYNTGTSPLTDKAFDALKDELSFRNPNHPFLKKIGAAPSTGSRKVPLPYKLFSLDKVKADNGTLEKWLNSHKGPYVVSDKEDGNSLEIVYDKSEVKIFSRGDGTYGQDISHLIPHLPIPRKLESSKKVAIRAELILPVASFNSKFSAAYKNPRNLIAGAVNKKIIHEAVPFAKVVAYEIIEPRMKPSDALHQLKIWGFEVVPYKRYHSLTGAFLSKLLIQRRSKSKYEIDGIVIEQDQVNKRPTSVENPSYVVAFKENYSTTTTVVGVEWEESQYGTLKPIIVIKPLVLDGVTINKVTGHNAFFIENGYRSKEKDKPIRPINKGAIVEITRSGGVIPHIVQVLKGASRPALPDVDYKKNKSGVDLKLRKNTDLVNEKLITSFFSILGVEFIKLGIVQKLAAAGFDSLPKILKATVLDFSKIPSFQSRMSQKLWDSIHNKIINVELHLLMYASGVFGEGLGSRKLKVIVNAFPNICDWNKPKSEVIRLVSALPGFQVASAQKFAVGLPKFQKWLKTVPVSYALPQRIKTTGKKLLGQVVVFTGFRDSDLEKTIILQSGSIGTGVNSKATILLVKEAGSSSSKALKAKEMGIDIMSKEKFMSKFKL